METNFSYVVEEIVKIAHKVRMIDHLKKEFPQHTEKFDEMLVTFNHQIEDLIGALP